MIPDSLAALVSFLLLLAPGIMWQTQQEGHSPAVKETALAEVSRVVLASLIATFVAILVLLFPVWLPLLRRANTAGVDALATPGAVVPYACGVIATSALACTLAYGTAKVRWRGRAPIGAGRVWNQIFVGHLPAGGGAPLLMVELHDGTVWRGHLESFDTDPEDHDRGLALAPPLARKRTGEQAFKPKGDAGRYVILTESQITSLQVIYVE